MKTSWKFRGHERVAGVKHRRPGTFRCGYGKIASCLLTSSFLRTLGFD